MARQIGLVAPSRRRRGGILRAREQYEFSPVFRRARDYCERAYGEWYVMSTVHHLVLPQQVIGASEPPLMLLPASERQRWAEGVAARLRERCERSAEPLTFVVYASQEVADLLMRAAPFADFALPLAGMGLRERLRWYDERLRVSPRVLAQP